MNSQPVKSTQALAHQHRSPSNAQYSPVHQLEHIFHMGGKWVLLVSDKLRLLMPTVLCRWSSCYTPQ